jgi:hypothetical protein
VVESFIQSGIGNRAGSHPGRTTARTHLRPAPCGGR